MSSTASRHRLSEAERAERRARDRELTSRAVAQLRTSSGWHAWLRVRARTGLRRYSLRNQLLIALQKLASHCLLERDGCRSGPTAASIRAAAPRRDGYDFRGIRWHLSLDRMSRHRHGT